MQLIYPHELVVVAKSSLQVEVVNSFYRGNNFLIEAHYEKGNVFFESAVGYPAGTSLFLERKSVSVI
jgi:hypothetical protein